MSTGIYSWSQTASSNATADSTINWAEGQAPSSVNDSARALMSIIAKWRDDLAGVSTSNALLTAGGSANAITLTTNGSIAALTNGWTLSFMAASNNTSATTFAPDGLTAKQIQLAGSNLVGGEIAAGSFYTVTYHATADVWVLHSAGVLASTAEIASGSLMLFQQTSAPTGWTKQSTHDNKALRVVSGTASSGGATAFTSVFGSGKSTSGHALSVAEVPVGSTNNTAGSGSNTQNIWVSTSAASSHTHGLSLDLQYVDIIIASKN